VVGDAEKSRFSSLTKKVRAPSEFTGSCVMANEPLVSAGSPRELIAVLHGSPISTQATPGKRLLNWLLVSMMKPRPLLPALTKPTST
jgi:hypothetical protein